MSRLAERAETLFVPLFALLVSALVLAAFVAMNGADPLGVFQTLYRGGFGTWFSFQNTLQRAAPLMLTALCTALPARLGLIIIGGEGALVIGGLAATVAALSLTGASPVTVSIAMALSGAVSGGLWIGLVGGLLQRTHHLPDATVLVLQGIVFLSLLSCETLYGRVLPFGGSRGR